MDLTTRYLGLRLRTPLVVAASPLSEDIDNIRRRVVNIEKIRRLLRWTPSTTLNDGLAKTKEWSDNLRAVAPANAQ